MPWRAPVAYGGDVRVAALAVLCLLLLPLPAGAAASRGTTCPDARYAIVGPPVGTGATVEVGSRAGIGTACPLTGDVALRGLRDGTTRVRARWLRCPGLAGRVRLAARLVDGCTRVVGTIRAGRLRRTFEARRVDCGDGILEATPPAVPYVATRASLDAHPLPRWFEDAKFGIMIHWGIFTIPAWAELVIDPADWLGGQLLQPPDYGREFFTHIPYVEWYENTIQIPGSPAQQHHADTWGADFPYAAFRPLFETQAAAWSAAAWADAFRDAGARYVVLVTKHHDGFALWPTDVPHPTTPGWHMARDVVGELDAAVRGRCMRMGLYYSGGFDWSVQNGPVETALDALTVMPNTPAYVAYADGQWRELIARYHPAVLWNDIGYPLSADPLPLFADYYNAVPDGVINDRFTVLPGGTHHDYVTPEFTVLADISAEKFETVRGMGRGFGYNQNESDATLDTAETLIRLLVDVVSKNGNLLLNVGPKADGSIPAEQTARLQAIGAWLRTNGEAIFATRPWTRAEGTTGDGTPVRFTRSADGSTVYAIVLGPVAAGELVLPNVGFAPSAVRLLGVDGTLASTTVGADVHVTVPPVAPASAAYAFALAR